METIRLLTQIAEEQGRQSEALANHFHQDDERFAALPTKDDLEELRKGLASKEDVARLNNIVHTFTLGVQILSNASKWMVYLIITLGAMAAGWLILKGWVVGVLAWLGFTHIQ